jgi:hypothetical protein
MSRRSWSAALLLVALILIGSPWYIDSAPLAVVLCCVGFTLLDHSATLFQRMI